MQVELTKKECVLLAHLLNEEIDTINDLVKEVDDNDAKELKEQIALMNSVISKIVL